MIRQSFILKKTGHLLLHIIFWCIVLTFYTYFFGLGSTDINYVLNFSLFLMPITIATTYLFVYKLIPEYLIPKQYLKFLIYTVYTVIISGYLITLSIFYGLIFLSQFDYDKMAPISRDLFFVVLGVYFIVLIASAFKLFSLQLKNAKKTNQLETKILETQLRLKEQELNYLKMQIHPHFLFNTLNTLYGFALKKAKETPEMIIKLSNLLDYLLYQADKPFVSLSEELNHIEDYISLEKMRFNDSLKLTFNKSDFPKDFTIAPMLLIPFVENSFKHGTLKNGILTIAIDLTFKNDTLYFSITNSSTKDSITDKGIGLENIKKRLQLIYPNNHTLVFKNDSEAYSVELTIKNN